MQSTITRRAALTGTAAGAAAIVAGTGSAVAARSDPAIRDLWAAWCDQLIANRDAHRVEFINGVPVGVENRERQKARLEELTDAIVAVPASTSGAMALKLAHWKWYRHDFDDDKDARVLLPACDALAELSGIDFDGIALDAGLSVWLPNGTYLRAGGAS